MYSNSTKSRFIAFVLFVLPVLILTDRVSAQLTIIPIDSSVQAYFGSQSSAYEASDPTGSTWTAPGYGPYTVGSPLPNLPAPPTPIVYPASAPNSFGPTGHTSNFADPLPPSAQTTASSTIAMFASGSPSVVSDASILIPSWNLTQGPAATGYAYEQLDFVANYGVIGGVLGASAPALPLSVSGNVSAGSTDYAQFDATLQYTWQPSNNTAFSATGPAVPLGTLNYTFLQNGGGSFSTTINASGSLLAAPTNWGLLEITGYMWLAGDPSSISINSVVPEPSSLGLLAIGLVALGRRAAGRRNAR